MKSAFPNNDGKPVYTDEEVLAAIRGEEGAMPSAITWFFRQVREYVLELWKKEAATISIGWYKFLFTSNTAFMAAVRNGLVLEEGMQLATYYAKDHLPKYLKHNQLAIEQQEVEEMGGTLPTISEALNYTDEEVIRAIRTELANQAITNWFFAQARPYALNNWQGNYSRLLKADWDIICSDADYTLIKRIKKETWELRGASLKTYYTEIVRYAILDYLNRIKESDILTPAHSIDQIETSLSSIEQKEKGTTIKQWFIRVIKNENQVKVVLLVAKGFSHKEIVAKGVFGSTSSSINAYAKGMKKIKDYIMEYPAEGRKLKDFLKG